MNNSISIITAGAGTGKTYNLTQHLADLLADPESGVRPGGVLATTFTRRAAANLRERAEARLIREGHHEQATELGSATIGTVNAVCGALLERYAYDIGLSPRLEVISDHDATVLFKRAVSSVLDDERVRRMNALATRLGYDRRDQNGKTRDWRKDLRSVADLARQNGIPAESLPRHGERAIAELLRCYETPTSSPGQDGPGPRELTAELHRALLEAREQRALFEAQANGRKALETIEEAIRGYANGYFRDWDTWRALATLDGGKPAREVVEGIKEVAQRFPAHPELQDDIRRFTQELYQTASQAMSAYQHFKSERGLIDFVDQEAELLQALENPSVRARLQEEFDVVLVDEFQDTSPIQLAIFLKLHELLPKSIWVGDPKQSIYAFRGADPGLMERAVDALSQGRREEVLSTSFRARPSLIDFTNSVFTEAFRGAHSGGEVELVANRAEVPECGPPVGIWNIAPESGGPNNAAGAAAALADGVVRYLGSAALVAEEDGTARPLRPGDVAILCRTNEDVGTLAEELACRGIPAAHSRSGLLQTPEGVLMRAVLRYLADRRDTLAQAEIKMLISDTPDPARTVRERIEAVQEEHDWRRGHPAFEYLDELFAEAGGLSVCAVLDHAIAGLDIQAVVSRWGQSERRRGNIDAFRTLARQYQDAAFRLQLSPTVAGFVLRLEDLARDEQDDQAPGRGENAVNVLTYHKAKGLEWPVVVATDLGKGARTSVYWDKVVDDRAEIDMHAPLSGRWVRFWVDPFEARATRGIPPRDAVRETDAWKAEEEAALAESRRLLYVGFTRARDKLILALRTKRGTPNAQWLIEVLGTEPDWIAGRTRGKSDDMSSDRFEYASLVIPDQDAGSTQAAGGAAAEESGSAAESVLVYPRPPARRSLRPYRVLPSALQHDESDAEAAMGAVHACSGGIRSIGEVDPRSLGDAVHAFFAYFLSANGENERDRAGLRDSSQLAEDILEPLGLDSAVSGTSIESAAAGLLQFIGQSWPVRDTRTEVPLRLKSGGRLIAGTADLVVDTERELVLVDHKVILCPEEAAVQKAAAYAGQLTAYKEILERAEGKSIKSMWIHLPVQGKLVEIRG